MNKRIWLAAALLVAVLPWCGGAEPLKVEVEADPAEFPAGEWTRVSIKVNREVDRRAIVLPKHTRAKWHPEQSGVSHNLSIVNGRSSRSMTYTLPLSSDTPGVLTLPPVEVRLPDGATAKSRPLQVRVLSPGEAPRGAGDPTGRIVIPEGRRGFYAGEEIPVDFELTVPPDGKVRELDYPRMNCDGPVILPDLSRQRTRHPHFLDPERRERDTPEGPAREFVFRTQLRFMRAGNFKLGATQTALAADPRARRRPRSRPRFGFGFDDDMDDFFADPFGGGTRRVVVNYPVRELRILPVPPPPAGTRPLELFGKWRSTVALSASSARVGDVLELEVRLDGSGSLAGFRPPQLDFPGFRVYPPELKREPDGRHSIRYALVPLRPGEYTLDPKFALFDAATGSYRRIDSALRIAVTGSPLAAPTAAPAAPRSAPAKREAPSAPPVRREAATSPPAGSEPVPGIGGRVPGKWLWHRGLVRGVLAAGALGLAALLIEFALRRRDRRKNTSPEAAERRQRVEMLIRRCRRGDDALEILGDGGAEALARALGLFPGVSYAAIAEKVAEPSLRKLLEEADRDAFAPESERRHPPLSPAGRREFVRIVKRLLVVLLAGAALTLPAADTAGAARLHLERTVLLHPRSAAARRALERTVRELGETPETPAAWRRGRDLLRPDEYLTLAGALLGAALLAVVLLRRKHRRPAFILAWLGAVLAALGAAAAWSQYGPTGGYRDSRAVVTAPELELYALPVAGGKAVATLKRGAAAEVVETRGAFIRLRAGGSDGWCRASGAERISPR